MYETETKQKFKRLELKFFCTSDYKFVACLAVY